MRLLLLLSVLFFLISCQKSSQVQEGEASLPSEMIEGKTPVKKNSKFHGAGLFVGRPIKTSERGILFDTYEAQISVGSFQNSFYLGGLLDVSMESEAVFNQFDELDTNETYVFRFERPYGLNPEIEETHWLIRSIEPLQPDTKFEYRGVTKASEIEKSGNYSHGDRPGKIIAVKRWGFFDIDCSVELNMGALGMTVPESALAAQIQASQGNIENLGTSTMLGLNNSIVFNVYSEEGCAFAEQALISGRDVTIEYTEDHIEWWDEYSRVVHEIRLSDNSSQPQFGKTVKREAD